MIIPSINFTKVLKLSLLILTVNVAESCVRCVGVLVGSAQISKPMNLARVENIKPAMIGMPPLVLSTQKGNIFSCDDGNADHSDETEGEDDDYTVLSSASIGMLKFYKSFISPLLPPACRFLPTCSVYSQDAIREFGPEKGLVLTAWRLFRCAPWGGRGYDPPKWPPVGLRHGSY